MERRKERAIVACYREFAPHPALGGRVRALFSFIPGISPAPSGRRVIRELTFTADERFRAPMFADGQASIVFDLGAVVHEDGVWVNNDATRGGKVIGPMSHVASDGRVGLPAMLGAYLHPAQLSTFAALPTWVVTDSIIPIEEAWGADASDLSERFERLDERGRVDLLEAELLRRMSDPRTPATSVDIAGLAGHVVQRKGAVSVEALANAAGVSRQYLTRVFREHVGVSPKLYTRLARFQSALVHAREGSSVNWSRVAGELGYADQSHMIAEFREFSSLTPHMLATGRWFHPFIERAKARR